MTIPSTVNLVRSGVVVDFDDHVGAGRLVDVDDEREWWFHCTRIADGSRHIETGASVGFRVTTGPTGLEATDVTSRSTPFMRVASGEPGE